MVPCFAHLCRLLHVILFPFPWKSISEQRQAISPPYFAVSLGQANARFLDYRNQIRNQIRNGMMPFVLS